MGNQPIDPLELEVVTLPPIPGPLPATFFADVPYQASAVFSTFLGSRPLRPLPNPAPHHSARPGSDDDIRKKAWSLLHSQPNIAEAIMSPPENWHDLYAYFDAVDLWTEGAGFLFRVLGFIVTVNMTRFNCLHRYAGEWVSRNEERLANIPLEQDILSSLSTIDDQAWFDVSNMTVHESITLNSVLSWHRGLLREKRDALQALQPRHFEDVNLRTQAHLRTLSTDSVQRIGVPVKSIACSSPQSYYQRTSGQALASDVYGHHRSNSYYSKSNTAHSHARPVGCPSDNAVLLARNKIPDVVRNRNVYVDGGFEFGYHQNRHEHGHYPKKSLTRRVSACNEPIYVLDPLRPPVGVRKEAIAAQVSLYDESLPFRSSQRFHDMNHSLTAKQDRRPNSHFANATHRVSNDARLQYDAGFRKHLMDQPFSSRTSYENACTVYLSLDGGGLGDATIANPTVRLLSECGPIFQIKPVGEGLGAMVTFENPDCALHAVSRFDGYSTENNRILTVQCPRKGHKEHSNSYNDSYSYTTRNTFFKRARGGSQALSHESFSQPNGRGGGSRYAASRQFSGGRTTEHNAFYSSRYSPPHKTPTNSQKAIEYAQVGSSRANSHGLPPKPQLVPLALRVEALSSSCFRSQLGNLEDSAKGPRYGRHDGFSKEPTSKASENMNDRHRQNIDDRGRGSAKRVNLKDTGYKFSTPTHTPVKKCLSASSAVRVTVDDSPNAMYVSNDEAACVKHIAEALESSSNAPVIGIVDELHKLADALVSDANVGLLENDTSALIPNTTSAQAAIVCVEQPVVTQIDRNCSSEIQTGLDVKTRKSSGAAPFTAENVDSSASSDIQQKKNSAHSKQRKKKSQKLSRGSRDDFGESLPSSLTEGMPQRRATQEAVGVNSYSPIKAETNRPIYTPIFVQEAISPVKVASGNSIQHTVCISQKDKSNQKLGQHYRKVSGYSPENSNGVAVKRSPNPQAPAHTNVDSRSAIESSTRKPDSDAKNSRNQRSDGSPVSAGKTQTRLKKKPYERKIIDFDRKENEQPLPDPIRILSDPIHWPALGSSKTPSNPKSSSFQKTVSTIKPLGERRPPPSLSRRDSLASIVSRSPQPLRRLTIDVPISPTSGGSPLWPVVKRWDGHGQPVVGECKSASTATDNGW